VASPFSHGSGVKQNGYVIGSKRGIARRSARADNRLMVFSGAEAALELAGNLVEAGCGVAHDKPRLSRACVACAHRAGLARILCGCSDMQSGLREYAGDGVLLLSEREGADGAGEVLYGVELVVSADDGDADGIYLWIHQVSAVMGRVHPEFVDGDGVGGFGYVFRDNAEVGSGAGSAGGEVGFVVELMGDSGVLGHLSRVLPGSLGEDGIETEGWKSLACSGLVCGGEEVLFRDREGAEMRREQEDREEGERFLQ
jgi:hypothetical protein